MTFENSTEKWQSTAARNKKGQNGVVHDALATAEIPVAGRVKEQV